MKLLFSILAIILSINLYAQQHSFIGKVEYVKESKLLSGEFAAKQNGESVTYFNTTHYVFIITNNLDLSKMAEKLSKTMPPEIRIDSFEMARQKEKIKNQLSEQMGNSTVNASFINYKTHIALRPRKIGETKYCMVDSMRKIDWQLKADTMVIDGLLCQKAIGYFVEKNFTVWFAPSIPFAAGPLNMHGLPGIIVLATSEDDKTRYRMKSVTYPLSISENLISCNGEQQINSNEFMNLQYKRRENRMQQLQDSKKEYEKK